ncbi:MAG TPA: MmgE/PrpD family protein [Burkholderiales bacterium]|nr:MmgE/PrpD family protein [Burkholderiales bacterium]
MHVVERFAAWAAGWRAQAIPAEVAHHARRAVIDWHAALLPGSVVAPVTLLKRALQGSDPRTRALINGTAAHTVEVDDIYRDGIYHPGAPTIAAAHALGFERPNFLRAVIVGYEISTRIGAAMGRAHYHYWHNTGTIGCFGACAAAAEWLKLDKDQFAHALATVTTFAAGLQQAFRMDSMSKPLHAGRAAEAGVTAALAAREGVTGSLDVLEGEVGFGRAMGDNPDWEKALAGLGRDFHITRMTFKNHACCGHTFAAIDGALALKQKYHLKTEDIERIDVGTYRAGVEVAHYAQPRTPAEARFSMKYVVATALTHGSVRLAAFEPARLSDRATRALMEKVSVALDPELDATFPRQRAARVAITARGRREELLQPTRKGDPDMPLSDAELEDKFRELAFPVLGKQGAQSLLARLWKLECA